MNRLDLRAWRTERWLTQPELAGLLGVNVITVWRWESGDSTVPAFLKLALERLDDLYDFTPDGYAALHKAGVA